MTLRASARAVPSPLGQFALVMARNVRGRSRHDLRVETEELPRGEGRCVPRSACKHGLRAASEALDELFEPERSAREQLGRALFGARSAPQGNRCYLPVQGSILIPSIIDRFATEFEDERTPANRPTARMPVPKFVDFDEATRVFSYNERLAFKNPDWTYPEN
jgi:hypothetical protein